MQRFKVFMNRRIPEVALLPLEAIADLAVWPESLLAMGYYQGKFPKRSDWLFSTIVY